MSAEGWRHGLSWAFARREERAYEGAIAGLDELAAKWQRRQFSRELSREVGPVVETGDRHEKA